jgi:hypothetical protein
MNRLIDPPGIRMAMQRMACTACGAEANASCTCGVAYVPKAIRAAEAVKASPEKSNRAIAADLGVDKETVRKARSRGDQSPPAVVIGQDGKSYPATKPPPDTEQALIDHAHKLLGKLVHLLRQMDQRQRLSFRTVALQRMADAHLDEGVIEF